MPNPGKHPGGRPPGSANKSVLPRTERHQICIPVADWNYLQAMGALEPSKDGDRRGGASEYVRSLVKRDREARIL